MFKIGSTIISDEVNITYYSSLAEEVGVETLMPSRTRMQFMNILKSIMGVTVLSSEHPRMKKFIQETVNNLHQQKVAKGEIDKSEVPDMIIDNSFMLTEIQICMSMYAATYIYSYNDMRFSVMHKLNGSKVGTGVTQLED